MTSRGWSVVTRPVPEQAKPEAAALLQAIADTDWDTLERHGGIDAVMKKIVQWEQENPASNGRGMIDDFRLRGARPCRHMGEPLTIGEWRTEVAHVVARRFNNPNAPLSEGEVLATVVQAVPGNPHWTRISTDCPNPMG